jgi:hypothetical protein
VNWVESLCIEDLLLKRLPAVAGLLGGMRTGPLQPAHTRFCFLLTLPSLACESERRICSSLCKPCAKREARRYFFAAGAITNFPLSSFSSTITVCGLAFFFCCCATRAASATVSGRIPASISPNATASP